MALLPLTPDEVLTTTRSVRRRLDLTRPVERSVLEECLSIAQQAPTGSNRQNWHVVIVTDPAKRAALADLYRSGMATYRTLTPALPASPARGATPTRGRAAGQYLLDHLHEVPVHVILCITGRTEGQSAFWQATQLGSIIQAGWSFMLAARARGLGGVWTTVHLFHEQEAAAILGIPYADVMQVALIPLAYTVGTDFKPAERAPLATMVHWDGW